jgi:signal transduction histidine kinase
MTGTELCERAIAIRPDVIRMILTAYADLHAASEAINRGQVQKFIAKPYRVEEVAKILEGAIEWVNNRRSGDRLQTLLLQSGPTSAVAAMNVEVAAEIEGHAEVLARALETLTDLGKAAQHRVKDDPDQAGQLLGELLSAAEETALPIAELRDLSTRLKRLVPAPPREPPRSDAASVVESAVRLVRGELERVARFRLVLEASPVVPIEAADLAQVVAHLLMNAAEAATAAAEQPAVSVQVSVSEGHGIIAVEDNGEALAAADIERAFDPFHGPHKPHRGVGLAIVKRLVEGAGGTVEARSGAGRGAVFTVRLPLVLEPRR